MEALSADVDAVAVKAILYVKLCLSTVELNPYKASRGCSCLGA